MADREHRALGLRITGLHPRQQAGGVRRVAGDGEGVDEVLVEGAVTHDNRARLVERGCEAVTDGGEQQGAREGRRGSVDGPARKLLGVSGAAEPRERRNRTRGGDVVGCLLQADILGRVIAAGVPARACAIARRCSSVSAPSSSRAAAVAAAGPIQPRALLLAVTARSPAASASQRRSGSASRAVRRFCAARIWAT